MREVGVKRGLLGFFRLLQEMNLQLLGRDKLRFRFVRLVIVADLHIRQTGPKLHGIFGCGVTLDQSVKENKIGTYESRNPREGG